MGTTSTQSECHKLNIELIAGGIAGIMAQLLNHPIDTIKTVYQRNRNMLYLTVCKDISKHGVANFWKGASVPSLSFGIVNSVSFASYFYTKKHFDPKSESDIASVGCATFSAFCQLVPWVPSEVIKIHMQKASDQSFSKSVTLISSVKKIYLQYGMKGFYHGMTAQMMRDIPNNIAYYICYEKMNHYLDKRFHLNLMERAFISGGITGLISWVIVIPMDLVKTRIQSRIDTSIISSYKTVFATGFHSFFHGTFILLTRSFSVNAMIFLVYEEAFPIIDKYLN